MTSKLWYWGTQDEVRLGDRIEFVSLILRRKRRGTVVCIPSKTALQRHSENRDPEDWLIRFDDGQDTGWMYHPEELQPVQRLRLINRNSDYEPVTNEELERQDSEIAGQTRPIDDFIGCGIVVVIALAAIMVVAVVKYGFPW